MSAPLADQARTGSPDPDTPPRALARLWVVVGVFVAVAVARAIQVGIGFRDPGGQFLVSRVALTVALFAVMILARGWWTTRTPRTFGSVIGTVREQWPRPRLLAAAGALAAYHVTYFCYHNLKSWNDLRTPRDHLLLSWDRALFGGHDPAVLLHDLLGQHLAAHVLEFWYESFATLVVIAFPASVAWARRTIDAYASIAAFCWVWILGVASYYAIPTLGPFASAPADFAGLPATLIQHTQASYLGARDQLIAHPHAHDSFAQVAAFASLHVGVTTVILGVVWWNRLRRATVLMAIFLAGTLVATVYWGWHFAIDDIAGLGIGALAWWLGPLTVRAKRPPASSQLHRRRPTVPA